MVIKLNGIIRLTDKFIYVNYVNNVDGIIIIING